MPEPTTCPLCGATAGPATELAPLPLSRCTDCGLTFRADLADADRTREIYEGGRYEERDDAFGYAEAATLEERRANARSRLAFVTAHVPPGGRLLDVGAAGGAFVLEAGAAGFTAAGIEPAPAFARHAREALGVDVRDGRVEDVAPDSADVITLWHVLEHLPDPGTGLQQLAAALKPGGRLVLEVPNLASTSAAIEGTAWAHLDPDAHVSHFTPASLRRALAIAGLEAEVFVTVPHAVYLTPAQRLTPRPLAARVKLALHARRAGRGADPERHDYLRVVARAGA